MSSLQSIMNVDEDQQDSSSTRTDKKDKEPATPAAGFRSQDPSSSSTPQGHVIRSGQQPSSTLAAPTTSTPLAEDSHVARPSQQIPDSGQSSSSAVQQSQRRVGTSEPRARTSAVTTSTASSSQPESPRRQRTTSVDSMDQHGYGSAASSSSMGGGSGGGGLPPNHPRRPMGNPNPEVPIRLTPITGRVSRAKKGVPVHTCDVCNPPKTFTRAEHLRRHQLSHQTPRFPCNYPGCDRAFHRQDLLTRHQQRHEQEGDKASHSGGDTSRRDSTASAPLEERMPGLRVGGLQPPLGFPPGLEGASTPSSTSERPPTTPNIPSGSFPPGGSPGPSGAGGGDGQYGTSSGDHQSSGNFGETSYTLHPGIPAINPPASMSSSPEPSDFNNIDFMAPRTTPLPLFIATQNLSPTTTLQTSLDNPPELIHATDYSPWASASDSNYSTPPEMSRVPRYWRQQSQSSLDWQANTTLLSPFPTSSQRDIHSPNSSLETMTAPYYVPATYTVSPHLAPAHHHTYGSLLGNSIMTGYTDEPTQQSLLDPSIIAHHTIHDRSPSVRSPNTPPSISTSGQAADTIVTPAPLHRVDPMSQVVRQKEMVLGGANEDISVGVVGGDGSSPSWDGTSPGGSEILIGSSLAGLSGCGISGIPVVTPLPRSVRNAIPSYLEVYWERFHVLYPFLHRPSVSVEEAGNDVLRCAMAAIATQYLNGKEDRIRGNQLHEYAWQEAKRYPHWNLSVMQAIPLCELFARFRGRKAVVRPSKLFESLYSRVFYHDPNMYNPALSSNPASLGQRSVGLSMTEEERWHTWLDAEALRRLLTACFVVDGHTSIHQQQPRARDGINPSEIPLTGPSDPLWAADSAREWATILEKSPGAGNPQFIPPPGVLTPETLRSYSALDQAAIINAEALRLPRRRSSTSEKHDEQDSPSTDDLRTPTTSSFAQNNLKGAKPDERIAKLFSHCVHEDTANVFIALHHTPLRDLLAVSGDSWVFSQKVLSAPIFLEHQKRLKAWVDGRALSVSPTTSHQSSQQQRPSPASTSTGISLEGMSAAKATIHAARALVGFFDRGMDASNGLTSHMTCISDYWGMYVCALIIWAFGHRATRSSSNSSNSPRRVPLSKADSVNWLRFVASLSADSRPDDVVRVRGRWEASAGVVSMVKRRLEADCVGGWSRLYVEALGVLRKLEEGVNRRSF